MESGVDESEGPVSLAVRLHLEGLGWKGVRRKVRVRYPQVAVAELSDVLQQAKHAIASGALPGSAGIRDEAASTEGPDDPERHPIGRSDDAREHARVPERANRSNQRRAVAVGASTRSNRGRSTRRQQLEARLLKESTVAQVVDEASYGLALPVAELAGRWHRDDLAEWGI